MNAAQESNILDSLRSGVQFFLDRTGHNAQDISDGMNQFLEDAKPDIYELLIEAASGHPVADESLELFGDAAVARAARLSLAFSDQERAAIGAILVAGLKTAIVLAVASA